MCLYATDTIVYKEINCMNDHSILREDHDTLSSIFVNVSSFRLPRSLEQVFFNHTFVQNSQERVDDHEYPWVLTTHNI